MTGATPGAGGGTGSTQVAFTTRSGTNEFNSEHLPLRCAIRDLNSNYYFNKVNGLDKNEVIVTPVRRPRRRADRHSGPLRRPEQGVLLLQLRAPVPAERSDPHAHDPQSRRRSPAIFSYNVTVGGVQQLRTVNLVTLAAAQRSDVDVRSDRLPALLDAIRAVARRSPATSTTPLGATNTAVRSSTRRRRRAISTRRRRASTST